MEVMMLKIINRLIFGTMLVLAISAIFSNVIKAEETTVETTNAVTATKKVDKPNAPKFIKGINKGKRVKLSWTKVKKAKGYIIYRNGKKIKTIKKGKTLKYSDKKVKYKKVYKYYIKSFKTKKNKKIKSEKSFSISVKIARKKDKVQNISDINIGALDHNPMTYGEKYNFYYYLFAKYDKKKYSKKIRWISSNKSLATVNSKGVVTINNARKNGTVKIYAVAHNGYREHIKIDVVDMMNPSSLRQAHWISDFGKPLINELLPSIKSIASYFMYDKPGVEAKFEVSAESSDLLKITPDIDIDKDIRSKIAYFVVSECYDVELKKDYIEFKNKAYYKDGYTEYMLAVCFNEEASEQFSYMHEYSSLAPRWYYAEVDH